MSQEAPTACSSPSQKRLLPPCGDRESGTENGRETGSRRAPLGPVRSTKRQATVLEAEEQEYKRQLYAALEASRAQVSLPLASACAETSQNHERVWLDSCYPRQFCVFVRPSV